jgi:hypothetical protein
MVDRQVRDSLPIRLLVPALCMATGSTTKPTQQDAQKGGLLTRPAPVRQDAPFRRQGRSE